MFDFDVITGPSTAHQPTCAPPPPAPGKPDTAAPQEPADSRPAGEPRRSDRSGGQ